MNLKDMGRSLGNFWNEFRKETAGLVGLSILVISVLIVVFEPLVLRWTDTNTKWRSIDYWQDNSPSSPPSWSNLFSKEKSPVTERLVSPKIESIYVDGGKVTRMVFAYDFQGDNPPLDLIFHADGTGDIQTTMKIDRPDGKSIELASRFDQGLTGQAIRISADNDGRDSAFSFVNGTQNLLTDSSPWLVSKTGFGSNYAAPTVIGPQGTGPWGTFNTIDANANYIWADTTGNTVYFSAAIRPNDASTPEPTTLSLLALGGGALLLRRRRA